MPDILVQRGGGVSQGDDVVNPLLTSTVACMVRGRIELDEASGLHPVTLECLFRAGLLLGELVEIADPFAATVRYGRITAITHRINGAATVTQLKVSALSDFSV